MDELARFNKQRWELLAQANVAYSRPLLTLDQTQARHEIDPHHFFGQIAGKRVLCLAASGGQQSAAFGLLGAEVTVFDLSDTQLQRDRQAAEHYGYRVTTVQGDMRDLSCFGDKSFDIVWHAYSLNFVPDLRPVLAEVTRLLASGGFYHVAWSNPFTKTVDDRSWTGEGYLLKLPYAEGVELTELIPGWDVWELAEEDGSVTPVPAPKEFNHKLSTMVNTLIGHGFVILHLDDDADGDPQAEAGSWQHYTSLVAPYLVIWARLSDGV